MPTANPDAVSEVPESGPIGEGVAAEAGYAAEQVGFRKVLNSRQIRMIAIGGAIGTGLFLGAGGRLASAGPALVLVYALCGFFAFLILRALAELILHRPSSGSFVSYAREFLGEKAAFAVGWLYYMHWSMAGIVDVTAVAVYVHYWSAFTAVPQWILALIALALVVSVNLLSVKVFGELEFWFALIKVAALVAFLIIGSVFLAAGWPTSHGPTGLSVLMDNGGLLPNGLIPAVIVIQGVIFAYGSIEFIGTAAGEAKNVAQVIPRAVNSTIVRIVLFYVGSVLLLTLLLPYTAYQAGESPFVTFFSSIGSPEVGQIAGSVMTFVALTAALSSMNAGLYTTGRLLHSMSTNGAAPRFTSRMSRSGVPYGGVFLTAAFALVGVGLNAVVPEQAFEIVLNLSALGIIAAWTTIMLCQIQLRRWSLRGKLTRPSFRLFGAPYTSYLTLAFLAMVLVLMVLDYPVGTFTVSGLLIVIPLLILGWFIFRGRIAASERDDLLKVESLR